MVMAAAEGEGPLARSQSQTCARASANDHEPTGETGGKIAMTLLDTPRESDAAKTTAFRAPNSDKQPALPRLPLPTLEDTSRRFLAWCEPLLDAGELEETKAALERFVSEGGPGERLQEALVAYDRQAGVRSWLDLFWQTRYLGRRDRIALNANVFLLFPDLRMSQTQRAASLIANAITFKQTVDEGRLPVERLRGRPLCMLQYKYLFATTRIPGLVQDTVRAPYTPAQPGPSLARHILVFHRGRIVRMDVIAPGGVPYHVAAIERCLDAIKASIEAAAAADESVSYLTTMARAEWATARAELIAAHPDNAAALEVIETALFNICLDDVAPGDQLAVCNNLLYGSSANRWYDKAVSLVVTANGAAGINAEHAMIDGMALIGFAEALHASNDAPATATKSIPAFAPVAFELTDDLREKTRTAARSFRDYGDTTASMLYAFDTFGANQVKEWGLSPDAFVQLALQLAHVRTKGFVGATYESIATRQFDHGRTEAMRVVTPEILLFVATMQDEAASSADKVERMRAAADTHVRRAKACAEGQAPEQHLWELMLIQKRRADVPEVTEELTLFSSPGWLKMRHDYLSTSSLMSDVVTYFGFGSTSKDCIGVGYAVRSDGFYAYLCTGKSGAMYLQDFATHLRGAMRDMADLLQSHMQA
jgi:carnitine O-acetyltransferase